MDSAEETTVERTKMDKPPEGLMTIATQHHTVEAPNNEIVSPDELSTTKEEEWVTKKKVEVVTKRQIATRVQREVLLEDGKVIQDSGPKVTTTTTEDTQKQESENTEHHDLGDGGAIDSTWKPVENGNDTEVFKEIREKKVTTREETNETVETEDIKHLGDISDEAYKKAIEVGGNVESLLVRAPGTEIARTGPRIVGHTTTKKKIIDTEDTLKKSQLDADGHVVINSSTFKEHEEINEENVPQTGSDHGSDEVKVEKSHHYKKTKDQEFVDYVVDGKQVGREMRYSGEATEAVRLGDAEWDSLSARLRRNRNRLLKEMEDDRKDALTRRPLDFHQEERTRKVETSKWLDHHFGSESASRSSKESEDDGTPQTSFINVTMKSAKPSRVFLSSPEPPVAPQPIHEKAYFKGVSDWKSRTSPKIDGGVQVLPTGPNHTFNSSPSPPLLVNGTKSPSPTSYNRSKSPSPQYNGVAKFPSLQNLDSPSNHTEKITRTTNYYRHERTTSPFGRSSPQYNGHHSRSGSSPIHSKTNGKITPTKDYTPPSITPPPRRRHYKHEREELAHEEPAPDYSPTPEPKSHHNTPPPEPKKKIYQRTRFAADIPPASSSPNLETSGVSHKKNKSSEKRSGGGLGESFRKLVGKLVGSNSSNKNKHQQQHQSNGITTTGGSSGGSSQGGSGGGLTDCGTQTNRDMSTVNRYYLGEDPFSTSLYGRESEYPTPPHYKRRTKKDDEYRHQSNNTSTLGRLSKSTSKLTNERQPTPNESTTNHYISDRGGIQTLPRKLQEHKAKKQVYVTRSNGESGADRYNRLGSTNSNSMFNVSIVNNVNSPTNVGPVKPARTYRSNLLRSKSFNVHAGGDSYRDSNRYTSNPHLHRLDESDEPLKSPGLITSISRSSRDLSHQPQHDTTDGVVYRKPLGTYDQNRYIKHNGYTSRSAVDTKKKIFLKGLMDRAPELYKTLHGGGSSDLDENHKHETIKTSTPLKNGKLEYSTSFRSSNTSSPLDRINSPNLFTPTNSSYRTNSPEVNNSSRTIVRRGSNDYTETVSYTTKSDDPIRPSVTNTVQSFTKKTVPMPGGRKERIESTETKTITKSKFRSDTPELHFDNANKYSSSNGGVIIEVRNTRK